MTGWGPLTAGVAATLAASTVGTYLLRGYALKRSLLDRPNYRSSHREPTPRGGGLAIVVSFLAALTGLTANGALAPRDAVAIGGAGLVVAAIGFWDDHRHVAARWRLLAHFGAACWLMMWLGPPEFLIPGAPPAVNALLAAAAALAIVWLINLFNFMDGIDGIASVETITVAFGSVLVAIAAGVPQLAPLPLLLTAAVFGFLVWNWPPARIFMGDVGSGFLGIVVAGVALQAGHAVAELLYAAMILVGVFVVDASITVIRRALRGERIYEAHRSHAYQRASRQYGAHRPVTVAVALINLLWLAPVALAVTTGRLPGPAGIALAYAPLILAAFYWGAGSNKELAMKD